ncbi:YdeI/OmpD-associated family protein [Flavobacterium alkalisoli]|uniref:YdeI/OmpD-associated family protein n=1 Tax=Flavobacterium alkalisoli TaxID=2602769 RepID=UPI003A90BE0A
MEERKTWDKTNQWSEELELLKSIINKTPLTETTKWGGIVYTYNDKNVLGIGGFKNFFTIWFFKGVFLKDEQGVLVNANEGNTKSLRQWRFTSKKEVNEKEVLKYINEAIEVEKAGLEIKPEKRETVIPEYLQEELDNSTALKAAFEQLTPFKQREYAEFIETARREATKLSRVEKIKPMILDGIGLNDKYR